MNVKTHYKNRKVRVFSEIYRKRPFKTHDFLYKKYFVENIVSMFLKLMENKNENFFIFKLESFVNII